MKWLKTTGSALVVGFGIFLAIFASVMHKQAARKWQEKSVDIEKGNVKSKTMTAEAASTKAKLHDAKADEIVAKAEKRIKEKDETTADILARWT